LSIVKAALEDQGGRVRLESIPGQGAKFIFTIPKNLIPAKPLY
jgi:signal transduction histidine kinase